MDHLKHIMILGHVPLPKEHPDFGKFWRHPGRWVLDQAKALSDFSNYQVTLVTLVKGASQDFEMNFGSLRVLYLKAQSKLRERTGFVWDIVRLHQLIKRENPDLVHAHGTEDAYGLAILKTDKPQCLTIQGLYHDVNKQEPAPFLSPPYVIQKLESICLNRFDQAIVKSNHVKKLAKFFFPHLKLSVIPNTLSEEFLHAKFVSKNIYKLAFVGAVLPRKGFHLIREALELIDSHKNKYELHVFGDGGDVGYVDEQIRKIKATGHLIINHGCVRAETLAKELTFTNLLIAPSYAETFGNQVIEAMLCRCHCIVSDETGMADNVRKYGHGTIVPQRNSEAIAKAIKSQIKNGISEGEMQKREDARSLILEHLGPEKVAEKLSQIYRQKLI